MQILKRILREKNKYVESLPVPGMLSSGNRFLGNGEM